MKYPSLLYTIIFCIVILFIILLAILSIINFLNQETLVISITPNAWFFIALISSVIGAIIIIADHYYWK